jgi:hypothetical protein
MASIKASIITPIWPSRLLRNSRLEVLDLRFS